MGQIPDPIPSTISVYPMRPEEKPELKKIFYRSFPLIQRLFITWTPYVFVAKRGGENGEMLGGVLLKVFKLPKGRKCGFISWIFTDEKARGLGAGQRLVEASMDFFKAQGCHEAAACVEGYNASSGKLFSTRGFSRLSPGEHFKRYGWGIFSVWFHMFHLFDIGHFVWAHPGTTHRESPVLQGLSTLLLNSLIMLFLFWRHGDFEPLSLAAIPLFNLLFIGLRYIAMKRAAAAQGLQVRFRTWETGFVTSLAVALLFGGIFPIPGSVYPVSDQWSYRKLLPKLGPVSLAGIIPALLLSGTAWGLLRFVDLSSALKAWMEYALVIGSNLAFYDTVLFFFPFASYNGRRIWDWKRPLWFVLAAAALVILFV